MQPTLLILAAGMASRYGSMKQTQGFGPSGETIMDYSIYDAIRAGFGKVVFIIRKDFAEAFKAQFEPKLNGKIKTEYVYQEMNSYLGDLKAPVERTKPKNSNCGGGTKYALAWIGRTETHGVVARARNIRRQSSRPKSERPHGRCL